MTFELLASVCSLTMYRFRESRETSWNSTLRRSALSNRDDPLRTSIDQLRRNDTSVMTFLMQISIIKQNAVAHVLDRTAENVEFLSPKE